MNICILPHLVGFLQPRITMHGTTNIKFQFTVNMHITSREYTTGVRLLVGKPGENNHLQDTSTNGRIILKEYLQEIGWVGVNRIALACASSGGLL